MSFIFVPTDGYRNPISFPTTPASEADFRASMQSLLDQIRDYLNTSVIASAGGTMTGLLAALGGINLQVSAVPPDNMGTIYADGGNGKLKYRDLVGFQDVWNSGNAPGATNYQKLPNGRIIQWGSSALLSGSVVNFGVVFPTAVRIVLVTLEATSGSASFGNATLSNFKIFHNAGAAISFSWIAIGD